MPGILEEYYLWGEYDCDKYSGRSDKHRVMFGHLYEETPAGVVELDGPDSTLEDD